MLFHWDRPRCLRFQWPTWNTQLLPGNSEQCESNPCARWSRMLLRVLLLQTQHLLIDCLVTRDNGELLLLVTVERKDHSWSQLIDVYLVQVYNIGLEWTPVGALQFAFRSYNITLLGWHPPSATRCWGGLGVLQATPQVDWAPFKLKPRIDSFCHIWGSDGSL